MSHIEKALSLDLKPPKGTVVMRRSVRRTMALAQAEGLLLRRSLFALATAVGAPLLLVAVQVQNSSSLDDPDARLVEGNMVVTSAICLAMIFSLYTTLVSTLVSRRESLVLKRLRSGELRDGEVIAGTAVPALTVAVVQIVSAVAAAAGFWGVRPPTNVVLLLPAVTLGSAVFIMLAAVTAAFTPTVELAQLTALPLMIGSLVCSGLMFPIALLPPAVEPLANVLPLTSVVDLLGLGLSGHTRDGDNVDFMAAFSNAGPHLLVLLAWAVLSIWSAQRWFRWEPRR